MVEYRFSLAGDVEITSSNALRRQLLHVVNTTTGNLVLDCHEVTFMDSAAIATLLSIRRVLGVQRRRLRLENLHGMARHATDALGLTDVFTVAELEPA
jgi:anti-anti-sigma factor